MQDVHLYRLPAPFGSVGFRTVDGVLDAVLPSTVRVEVPDAAPESVCRWMDAVDKYFAQGCGLSNLDLKDLMQLPVLQNLSDFSRRVLEQTARLAPATLTSYTDLAQSIGEPTAARAVARVMASNPLPILIPCHRVAGRVVINNFDVTDPKTISGPAYMGQKELAGIAGWLRMHEISLS